MYCGRRNQVPFAMATVRSWPDQSSMSPKILAVVLGAEGSRQFHLHRLRRGKSLIQAGPLAGQRLVPLVGFIRGGRAPAGVLLGREMREHARMGTTKPRQSLTGIVGADEGRVWAALLEASPYLTPRMREMITGSHGMLRFPARLAAGQAETSPVPGVNVEADNDSRTLAISGQWWFRGIYSVTPQGCDTLLRYRVLNAAPGATRWLVPLVARPALRASARPQFEQTLTAVGSLLGCPARLAD
jgi:hypothetical protein